MKKIKSLSKTNKIITNQYPNKNIRMMKQESLNKNQIVKQF